MDYYSKLGVSSNPTQQEIEDAFQEKAKKVHPDQSDDPDATKKFVQLQKAREYLLTLHSEESGFSPGASSGSVLSADHAFPYPDYLPHQREILQEAAAALFQTKRPPVVVIDAPTGIGKSGINIALGRMADSTFYTTPQKKLRQQLDRDDALAPHHSVVKARSDYICDAGTQELPRGETATCASCPINIGDEPCAEYTPQCQYWSAKEKAFRAQIATLTFSYLIVDGYLQTFGEKYQISFADRDLLIIDEAHSLEEQVASLHAGFSLSPKSLSADLFDKFESDLEAVCDYPQQASLEELISDEWAKHQAGIEDSPITRLYNDAQDYLIALENAYRNSRTEARHEKIAQEINELKSLIRKLDLMRSEINEGRDWVCAVDTIQHGENNESRYRVQLKPVYVDNFLKRFVWSRADKIVLSSATIPFRSNPSQWLQRIGLGNHPVRFIDKPMPFPQENRPIYTDTILGKFSGEGFNEHFEDIVQAIDELANHHKEENGLIHTVSYPRAKRLGEALQHDTLVHKNDGQPIEYYLMEWEKGDANILLSPSMMEGVDLPGDKCRWQVLAKVPYLDSHNDPRASHLIKKEKDWDWYFEVTARRLVQSAGRAVRNMEDSAAYYVLDESFYDVISESDVPDWFTDAIVNRSNRPELEDG